ncbi:type II toxin-antitoxin system HicA family toxin [Marinifilum caeruleilacunae]|uniref:Type II toxin-antitoxin system HicA family toxin n=1 Tax=Marinifilum caeruleilacunae TaxID=2499076 RepID=A0ABX1X2N8_9BACT|nr:type II toxin-antitoxin system HicA family toxin [Marinifilum caeruleilacunae]NOU62345.1 type II toxin-antitoxin system HicA family toxin [Marinifilum caeruleilacunae]
MGQKEKLIKRLLSLPKDFTIQEMTTLLKRLGYKSFNKGATSGSRIAFVHEETKHVIRLHKPHPGNEIKVGALKSVVKSLKDLGYI